MPDIGKAFVQIVPSAEGISGSISQLLGGEAIAAGRASGAGFASAFGGALAGGAIAKAGFDFLKDSMQVGMEFDAAMSQVAATMGTTVDQIGTLRAAAREAGRTTRFSATEGAQALNYMALAGYDAETSIGMLPNVLNLAAAGNMDLALASDMITDSQSALNLSLEDTTKLVDKMARASSKSNTSVSQLGEAILTVGGNANFMKGGTTELAAVLGVLADNGFKGSEGGTHLRNMLLSLTDPTASARTMMDNLGVSIFDAEGNMRGFAEFFPELQQALSELTSEEQIAALGAIFNTRDMATAQALLSTTTERWQELGGAIDDSAGAAQKMADTQTDNLQGDLIELKNKWDDLKIAISDGAEPAARDFVQKTTGLLDGLIGLLPQMREAAQVDAAAIAGPFIETSGMMGDALRDALSGAAAVAADGSLFLDAGLEATAGFSAGASSGLEEQVDVFQSWGQSLMEALGFGISDSEETVTGSTEAVALASGEPIEQVRDSMFGWGSHAGGNFAAGLGSRVEEVSAAAQQLANAAAVPLKHTVPQAGPLADDDTWGLHMAENFIAGMRAGEAPLRAQTERMAGLIRAGMQFDSTAARTQGAGPERGRGEGNDAVVAELRELRRAILSMGFYVDGDALIGTVNGGLGRIRAGELRRRV